MKEQIITACEHLEFLYNIKVLFVVEQGSRTWGLDNKGSDYDVKFVYVHKLDKYLNMNKPRDYIEHSSNDGLINMVGYDIYKFAALFSKSNPNSIEMVRSPILYYGKIMPGFKWLAEKEYNPRALVEHYRSLCKKNYIKYIKSGNDVRCKRYLCCLRGLLNALYIKHFEKLPSGDFNRTMDILENELPMNFPISINKLVDNKLKGINQDKIDNIKELDDWIETFIETKFDDIEKRRMDVEAVNKEVKNIVYNQR